MLSTSWLLKTKQKNNEEKSILCGNCNCTPHQIHWNQTQDGSRCMSNQGGKKITNIQTNKYIGNWKLERFSADLCICIPWLTETDLLLFITL